MIIHNTTGKAQFRADKMGKSDLVSTEQFFAGLNAFESGQEHQLHTHAGQDKLYIVLEGQGEVTVGSEQSRVHPGDVAVARAGEEHSLKNPGPERLVVMVVMSPAPKK